MEFVDNADAKVMVDRGTNGRTFRVIKKVVEVCSCFQVAENIVTALRRGNMNRSYIRC